MALSPHDRGDGPSFGRTETPREDRGDTLRAQPFTDDVFTDERSRERSGLPVSLIVGVALGAVLVGGVGWYAFKGAGVSAPGGESQTITADGTPYKMRPENPGGMQVENQDKLVYDRVAKGNAPKRVENLLPPPEEPKAPPKAPEAPKVEAPKADVKEVAPVPAPASPPKETGAGPAVSPGTAPKMAEAAPKAPETKPAETKPAETTASDQLALQAMVKAANETPAKPAAPAADPLAAAVASATGKAAPAAAPPPKEVQTASATPAPAVTPGAFQIQLASVPTEEAAQAEWKRISGRHKDELGALTSSIAKADLGEKGIYYRLRAGPLADKAAADSLCATLAADKIGCIVVKP